MKNGIGKRGWKVASLMLGVWLMALCPAQAVEAERVTITVGAMRIVDLPFEISGFRITDPSVVQGEAVGRQLRLMGLKQGASDIQVTGPGNAFVLYSVSVVENVQETLAAMRRDLDSVPELDLSASRNLVVIRGEVSNLDNWELLHKVLPAYEGQYMNLATFRPAPEVMMALSDALEKSGVRVTMEDSSPPVGTILLRYSGNAIFVSGKVYSERDIERVKSGIAAQDWLAISGTEDAANRLQAVLNLQVEPVMIEVDVVYVGLSETQNEQIGVNLANQGLIAVDTASAAFAGTIGRGRSSGFTGGYTVSSGLQGVLDFMASHGASRFRNAGHLTFRSNDTPTWREFHSGGTLKVRLSGESGGTARLEDIDYGLIMRIKGGLVDANSVEMEVQLEMSAPELMSSGDYDLKRNRVNTSVVCELDKTMVMGGMKGLVQSTAGPSGVPFLRSVPVVQWFFSESEDRLTDMQVLILLSPRLAGQTTVTLPVSSETADTETRALEPMREQQEKRARKRRFFFF